MFRIQMMYSSWQQPYGNRCWTGQLRSICAIIPILQLLKIPWTSCLISFLILQWLIPETEKRAITFAGTAKDGRLVHPTLRLFPDITWILPLPCIICPTLLRKHRWIRQFPVWSVLWIFQEKTSIRKQKQSMIICVPISLMIIRIWMIRTIR